MADRVHLTVLGVLDVLETQVARERGMLTECCLQVEVREREARFLDCGVVKCGPRSEALLVGPLEIFSAQSDGVGHCWTGSACQDARLPGCLAAWFWPSRREQERFRCQGRHGARDSLLWVVI